MGTGAADWTPEFKGDFYRRYSAALLNSELMVDCTEHIFDYADTAGTPEMYDKVTDLIITHCHSDHFQRESILRLAEKQKLRIGCDRYVKKLLGEHPNIIYKVMKPYEEKKMGKYRIMPVLANHDVVMEGDRIAFHYIIETPDRKTVFYGTDGAWLLRPTWNEMNNYRFDLMIFDCTVGDSDDWRLFEHNTIPMLRKMTKEIRAKKMLKEEGRMIATHLARTLHGTHEETDSILQKIKMSAAYDGMKVTI